MLKETPRELSHSCVASGRGYQSAGRRPSQLRTESVNNSVEVKTIVIQ